MTDTDDLSRDHKASIKISFLSDSSKGQPADIEVSTSYLDVQAFLDWDEIQPQTLKTKCIPFDIRCFLPPDWDVSTKDRSQPDEYLGLDKLPAKDNWGATKSDVVAMGLDNVDTYRFVENIMKDVGQQQPNLISKWNRLKNKTDDLLVSPLKLFLFCYYYATSAMRDAEARDRIELSLDKLALSTLLPFIFSDDVLDQVFKETDTTMSIEEMDRRFLSELLKASPLERPWRPELYQEENAIRIPAAEWNEIFGFMKHLNGAHSILLPLDYIDSLCRHHLVSIYPRFASYNPPDNEIRQEVEITEESTSISNFVSGGIFGRFIIPNIFEPNRRVIRVLKKVPPSSDDPNRNLKEILETATTDQTNRRNDYGFFYPIIDKFLNASNLTNIAKADAKNIYSPVSFNRYKLQFRSTLPLMPYIEEIDAREVVWARQAAELSAQHITAIKKVRLYEVKSTLPSQILENFDFPLYETALNDLIQAKRNLNHIKDMISVLNDEVQEAGYHVGRKKDFVITSENVTVTVDETDNAEHMLYQHY